MILEFDKNKKLLTPWSIVTYGEKLDLQLEFDLPACSCYQTLNQVSLKIYKKGNAKSSSTPLVASTDFFMQDDTTWYGHISLKGDDLKAYVDTFSGDTIYLDGQFEFQIGGNKDIKSQVFFIKMYHDDSIPTVGDDYVTLDDVKELIKEDTANKEVIISSLTVTENQGDLSPSGTIAYKDPDNRPVRVLQVILSSGQVAIPSITYLEDNTVLIKFYNDDSNVPLEMLYGGVFLDETASHTLILSHLDIIE